MRIRVMRDAMTTVSTTGSDKTFDAYESIESRCAAYVRACVSDRLAGDHGRSWCKARGRHGYLEAVAGTAAVTALAAVVTEFAVRQRPPPDMLRLG